MYTDDEWSQFEDMYSELDELVSQFLLEFHKNEHATGISVENNAINIDTEESWAYGGHDTDYHSIPLSYMWNDNWKEEERAKREKERIEKEMAVNAKLIAERNKEIADEQAKYIELHKRYGAK